MAGKIVTADPNPRHSVDWRGVTAVKPNRAEAFLAAGVPWRDPDEAPVKDVDLQRAGEALLKKWETQLRSRHARRTWHDAFPAERRAALHSRKSASGFRRLRRG